jgi:phosphoribosylformylglycinamidine (FGAM) synthase PurS component
MAKRSSALRVDPLNNKLGSDPVIEVRYKDAALDPVGRSLQEDVRHLGLRVAPRIQSSLLYRLIGRTSPKDRERIARDLLCDPVVQEYGDASGGVAAAKRNGSPSGIAIDVWYKPGVTDVAGESVLKGICDLNLSGVTEVRTGHRFRLLGVKQRAVAEKIAAALLVNPLVQDEFIHAD